MDGATSSSSRFCSSETQIVRLGLERRGAERCVPDIDARPAYPPTRQPLRLETTKDSDQALEIIFVASHKPRRHFLVKSSKG